MSSGTQRRVLVVEDDPVVAMVVEDTLRDMGLDVLIDLTLVDALSEVETCAFDAALVDAGLRGEDGRPIMCALRGRGVPFAVMSGGDLSSLAAEFPQVCMLSKPLDLQSLTNVVRELLDTPAIAPDGS